MVVRKKELEKFDEELRVLRTDVYNKNRQGILITGVDRRCGKTTVARRLAHLLWLDRKSVIYVDGDLRKPTWKRRLLKNESESDDWYCLDEVTQDPYDMLSGKPIYQNPAEFLGAQETGDFFEVLRQRYEYIIFDAPSVNEFTDAQILATYADAIYLVVEKNRTKLEDVKVALDRFAAVDAKIAGFILNRDS